MGTTMTSEAPGTRTGKRAGKGGVLRSWLTLLIDAVVPLGGYYLLRHYGVGITQALAITSIVPAIRVIWVAVRERSSEPLAVAVLLVTLVSIPIALVSGSPRIMLAKESIGTGPVGLWMIIGALRGKPAMSEPYRAFLARSGAAAAAWDRRVVEDARFRRGVRMISVLWGAVMVSAFAVHLVLALVLPVDTAVWATGLVIPGMVVVGALGSGPISGGLQETINKDVKGDKE